MNHAVIAPYIRWIPLVFVLLGVNEWFKVSRLRRVGKIAEATVVELEATHEGETPILAFIADDKKTYRVRVAVKRSPEDWSLGTKWPVIYDPVKPTAGRVNKPAQLWGITIFYVIATVVASLSTWIISLVLS